MSYSKEARGLSQYQAIENLRAIVSSKYFGAYEFSNGRISSDMMKVDSIGGLRIEPFRVGDLADDVVALLDAVKSKGTLYETYVQLALSEERLRAMNFEERLCEGDFSLSLNFGVSREGKPDFDDYSFRVLNFGFKESYFESEGLDLKNAKQKLTIWYREITRNLNRILPNPVQNLTFS